MSAFEVACILGYGSTQTVIRRARDGKIPGAVFLGHTVRFIPSVIEAFIRSGGEPQPPQPRFTLRRYGGGSHAGGTKRHRGTIRELTIDAEHTVSRERPERAHEPGQGPVGYEPRFLASGRNVTEDYPWPPPNK